MFLTYVDYNIIQITITGLAYSRQTGLFISIIDFWMKTPLIRTQWTRGMVIACMAVLITACQNPSSQGEPIELTPSLQRTLTPTSTRIWFPSTSTPTVFTPPEITPTPIEYPDFGQQILQDDFSNQSLWLNGVFDDGNVAFGDRTLNLAVSQPGGNLTSFRMEPYAGDFFWEITITANLCSPTDRYGLIFWSVNDQNYHRISFNCRGEFAVERVKSGKPAVLLEWSPSSQVPRGGLSPFRAGLWVGGGFVRLYLNDQFQSGIYLTPASGGIGIFADSDGGPAVNISYSDMQMYAVSPGDYPPTPAPTSTPTRKPFPTLPTP